jgi:hypothetical protein
METYIFLFKFHLLICIEFRRDDWREWGYDYSTSSSLTSCMSFPHALSAEHSRFFVGDTIPSATKSKLCIVD